jgi:hypothetical protein
MIDEFRNDYDFLSNYYPCKISISFKFGKQFYFLTFQNSEAAFQAKKSTSIKEALAFTDLTAAEAKKRGRRITLRKDWEEIKDNIMYQVVYAKFDQNLDLKKKLLDTNQEELIEGNWWNDTYWGVCNGVGQNKLGKTLMLVRAKLAEE